MAFSYEDWKKKDKNRPKPTVKTESFADWKSKRSPAVDLNEGGLRTFEQSELARTAQALEKQGPKSDKARQADADRFARGNVAPKSEAAKKADNDRFAGSALADADRALARARKADADRFAGHALENSDVIPKSDRARSADADRFAGHALEEVERQRQKARQADADRFAGYATPKTETRTNASPLEGFRNEAVKLRNDATKLRNDATKLRNETKAKEATLSGKGTVKTETRTGASPLEGFRNEATKLQEEATLSGKGTVSKESLLSRMLHNMGEHAKSQLKSSGKVPIEDRKIGTGYGIHGMANKDVHGELRGMFDKDNENDMLSEKAGVNLRLGTGDAVELFAGVGRWLAPDGREYNQETGEFTSKGPLISRILQGGADYLKDGYDKPENRYSKSGEDFDWKKAALDPEFYATSISRGVPQMLSTLIPAVGTAKLIGGIDKVAKMPKVYKTVLQVIGGSGIDTTLDAAMEAGSVFDEATRRGMTEEEAREAANGAFGKNLALIGGTSLLEFSLGLAPFTKAISKGAKLASISARTGLGAAVEGFQEGAQEGISASELGDDFSWADPSTVEAMLIGTILGGGMTSAMATYQATKPLSRETDVDDGLSAILNRAIDQMPPGLQAEFARISAELVESGYSREEADAAVMNQHIEQDPSFAEVLEEATRSVLEDKKRERAARESSSIAPVEEVTAESTPEVVAPSIDSLLGNAPRVRPIESQMAGNTSPHAPQSFLNTFNDLGVPFTPTPISNPMQAVDTPQSTPIDIQVGDDVNLQGTRPETSYKVENVDTDTVTVTTPNNKTIKVPKSRIQNVLNRQEEEITPTYGDEIESSSMANEPIVESVGNESLPPNFRKDVKSGIQEFMDVEKMSLEDAVSAFKNEYDDVPHLLPVIEEEAGKAFGYKPTAVETKEKADKRKNAIDRLSNVLSDYEADGDTKNEHYKQVKEKVEALKNGADFTTKSVAADMISAVGAMIPTANKTTNGTKQVAAADVKKAVKAGEEIGNRERAKLNFTIDKFEPKGLASEGLYSLGSDNGTLTAKVYQSAGQDVLDALEKAGYRYSKTNTVGPGKGRHFEFTRKGGYKEMNEINKDLKGLVRGEKERQAKEETTKQENPPHQEQTESKKDNKVIVRGQSLRSPADYKTEDLREALENTEYERQHFTDDKRTYNKYMDLLDKEYTKRLYEEEALEKSKKEPVNVKSDEPKLAKDDPEWMKNAEAAARARIASRKGRALSGLPMDDLVDYSIIGFVKLSRKAMDLKSFTDEMLSEFGQSIRLFMPAIYGQSQAMFTMSKEDVDEMVALASNEPVETRIEEKQEGTNTVKTKEQFKTDFEAEFAQRIEAQIEYLKNSGGKGVEQGQLVKTDEGEIVGRYGRISKNPKWYQDFYKLNGRKPNKAEYHDLAVNHLLNGFADEFGHIEEWTPDQILFLEEEENALDVVYKADKNANTKRLFNEVRDELALARVAFRELKAELKKGGTDKASDDIAETIKKEFNFVPSEYKKLYQLAELGVEKVKDPHNSNLATPKGVARRTENFKTILSLMSDDNLIDMTAYYYGEDNSVDKRDVKTRYFDYLENRGNSDKAFVSRSSRGEKVTIETGDGRKITVTFNELWNRFEQLENEAEAGKTPGDIANTIKKEFKFNASDISNLYKLAELGVERVRDERGFSVVTPEGLKRREENYKTILSLMSDDDVVDMKAYYYGRDKYKDPKQFKARYFEKLRYSGHHDSEFVSNSRIQRENKVMITTADGRRIPVTFNKMWKRFETLEAAENKEGDLKNEVETNSDRPLETSGTGEIQGTETDGAIGERSNGEERGDGRRDSSDVPGTGPTKPTTKKQKSVGRDVSPEHADETSGGTKSLPNLRGSVKNNFSITNELDSFGGTKTRFKNNVKALQTLKQLEDEGRLATPEEQAELVRYVGWGGLASAFDGNNAQWKNEHNELNRLVKDGVITQEEYDHARKTTQYAHYTSKDIITSMYQAVENMGVKGGRVLEPGMGIGHFFGLTPKGWKSDLTGVEFDGLTGKIAKQLYQKANVEVKPFQDFIAPDGYFDLAIGNPPYSDTTYNYGKDKLALHNYFFAKSLDKVRDGGVLAFVTSTGTMNAKGKTARQLMASKADFLGAIRLPSNAFKENAGTEVTTDIIFFQKRAEGQAPNHRAEFINTVNRSIPGRDGKPVSLPDNEYFHKNPEMILGDVTVDKLQNGHRLGVVTNGNFAEQLAAAIDKLPKNIYQESTVKVEEIQRAEEVSTKLVGLDEGNFAFDNGRIVQMSEGRVIERPDLKGAKIDRLKGLIKIRDAAKEALTLQVESESDAKIQAAIKKLNFMYDGFVKKYKTINSTAVQRPNITAMKGDPVGLSLLMSLEREEKGSFVKQDIFNKRIISFVPEITNVNTSEEALVVSLSQKGRVDIPYMSEVSGIEGDRLLKELGNRLYDNPESGWEIEDEYLSGNVRVKLEQAKMSAENDPTYNRNVAALEAVIPEDIPSDDIAIQFGAPWVPASDYTEFLNEFFKARNDGVTVRFIRQTGDWTIEGRIDTAVNHSEYAVASEKPGGDKISGLELIRTAMNSKSPVLKYTVGKDDSGQTIRDVDQDATSLARLKTQELEAEFQDWLFSGDERETRLVRKYNDEFNAIVLQDYNGSLVYGGETVETNKPFAGGFNNSKYILRTHQKNVVWRMVQGGNSLLAHVVGAGKTLEMIVAGMEMKRLGIVRKPLYIVPNNLFDQWGRDFRDSYPNANILMLQNDLIPGVGITKRTVEKKIPLSFNLSELSPKDKVSIKGDVKKYTVKASNATDVILKNSKGKEIVVKRNQVVTRHVPELETTFKERQDEQRAERGAALNKIAMGSYDAIILTHETFKRLPMSAQYSAEFVKEQVADLEFALSALLEEEGDNKRSVKQMENAKEKLEKRLEELMNEDGKDIAIPFEMLGVDQIFVDEAHKFKNLQFHTKLAGITGLNNTASQRSEDLYMKSKWLTKMRGGRGVVFATGTPISNTMAEMFTMQRYLQNDRLDVLNIKHFDMWAKMFGQTESGVEMDVAGGFKRRTRFKKFKNIPELMTLFKEVTDIKTAPMLDLPRPKTVNQETIVAPLSAQQEAYLNNIVARANDVQSGTVDKKDDNWLKITGDARKMSLDIRLAAPHADEDAESKLNLAVENVLEIWKKGKAARPDKNGETVDNLTQLVFADLGTPKAKKQNENGDDVESVDEVLTFDVYNEMREKLVKLGIPKEEMAFIHEANTPKRKEKLFENVISGKTRILFGSTEKMGAGMNVQERLGALHHIDAPWRPSDVEQREGRMIRQGNRLDEVTVYSYVTEGSFDRIMWDLLKNKAGFVEQIMNDSGGVREMEDVGTMELRFAHISAVSSGDNTILDKMKIDETVKDLRGAKEQHRKVIRKRKRRVAQIPEEIAMFENELSNLQKDIKNSPTLNENGLKLEIGGVTYTKRTEAADALEKTIAKVWKKMADGEKKVIGKVGSFEWSIKKSGHNEHTVLKGAGEHLITFNPLSATGSITRIENFISKMGDEAVWTEVQLDSLKDELESVTKTQDAPFKQDHLLDAAIKEQLELENKMLQINGNESEHVTEDVEEDSSEDTYVGSRETETENQTETETDTAPDETPPVPPERNEKDFATRAEIVKYITKHFKVAVGVGKFRKKALGIYKNKFAIIRTKQYGDFEVIAHEFGHSMDKRLGISARRELKDELVRFAENNLEIPKNMTEAQRAREGVAEYFRQRLYGNSTSNPVVPYTDVSLALTQFINDGLAKKNWDKRVDKLHSMIQAWVMRDGKQEIRGITSDIGSDRKPEFDAKRFLREVYTRIWDEDHPIYHAMRQIEKETGITIKGNENAYALAVLTRGTVGRAITFIKGYTFDETGVKTGESLEAILNDVEDLEEFGDYLVGKRALYLKTERGKTDTPITVELVEPYIKMLDSKYSALAKRIYDYQDRLLGVLAEGGLIALEQVETLRENDPYYVPFYRVMTESGARDNGKDGDGSGGGGYANSRKAIREMKKKGSALNIINPIESIIKNTHLYMSLADRNSAGRALADLASKDSVHAAEVTRDIIEEITTKQSVTEVALKQLQGALLEGGLNPIAMDDMDMDKVAKIFNPIFRPNSAANEILVWDNGKPKLYLVRDDLLYNSLVLQDNRQLNAIMKYILKPGELAKTALRTGITANPVFVAWTFLRSIGQLVVKTEATGLNYVTHPLRVIRGLNSSRTKNDRYWDWMSSGAGQSTLIAVESNYTKSDMEKMMLKAKTQNRLRMTGLTAKEKARLIGIVTKRAVAAPINRMNKINDALDAAIKIAEFEVVLKQTGGDRVAAALASRESDMDYKRKGSTGMDFMNRYWLFWNVSVQGPDNLARTFGKHPIRTSLRGLTGLTLPTILLYMMNRDDEEYQELESYEKDLYWNYPKGDGTFYKLRIPFEAGLVFKTIPEHLWGEMMDSLKGEDLQSWKGLPKNASSTMLTASLPVLLEIGSEYKSGVDMQTGRETVPYFMKESTKGKNITEQYLNSTSETAKLAGKALTKSPIKLEHAFTGLFGQVGQGALWGMDQILMAANVVEKKDTKDLKRSYLDKQLSTSVNDGTTSSITNFYKELERMEGDHAAEGVKGAPATALKRMRVAQGDLRDFRKIKNGLLYNTLRTPGGDIFPKEEKKAIIVMMDNAMRDIAREVQGEDSLDLEGLKESLALAKDFRVYEKAIAKQKAKEEKKRQKQEGNK